MHRLNARSALWYLAFSPLALRNSRDPRSSMTPPPPRSRTLLAHFAKHGIRWGLALIAAVTTTVSCKDTTEPQNYALSLSPAALTIVQGANGSATVTITRTNFTGAVTLSLGNAPTGVTGSFNPAAPTGTSSTLTVNVGAAVAAGVYNLTVDGTATAGNKSTPLTLTLSVPADYTLSLSPAALTIVQGANGSATVTITRTNFTGAVTLSLGNAPTGVTGSFNPAAPTGTSSTLTVNVGAAVAAGVYNLTVDGTATAGNKSTPLTLTVSAVAISFAQVSAGFDYSCAVTTDGAAYCWGWNANGRIGDGTTTDRLRPMAVVGGLTLAQVSAGDHTCGVTTGGAAYCWGGNASGQLGNGTTTGSTSPALVSGGLTFAQVSAGAGHTCGVTTGGAAYCWGSNSGGLGDGTTTNRLSPVAVVGGLTFAQVSAGANTGHTCGVTTGGAAYCWGPNLRGQLGNGGGTTGSTSPVLVSGGLTFAQVSAGADYTCGVTTGGAAYCWGANTGGQLGDGTTTDRTSPVLVVGGLTFAQVNTAELLVTPFTCGVTTGGAAYCWGFNGNGELGDGTATNRLSPVAVLGGLSFAHVSAGSSHACGVTTTSGAAYCWGWNGNGQLGDGTTFLRRTPVRVQP